MKESSNSHFMTFCNIHAYDWFLKGLTVLSACFRAAVNPVYIHCPWTAIISCVK